MALLCVEPLAHLKDSLCNALKHALLAHMYVQLITKYIQCNLTEVIFALQTIYYRQTLMVKQNSDNIVKRKQNKTTHNTHLDYKTLCIETLKYVI